MYYYRIPGIPVNRRAKTIERELSFVFNVDQRDPSSESPEERTARDYRKIGRLARKGASSNMVFPWRYDRANEPDADPSRLPRGPSASVNVTLNVANGISMKSLTIF